MKVTKVVREGEFQVIAHVEDGGDEHLFAFRTHPAAARLFEAAPELLAACDAMRAAHRGDEDEWGPCKFTGIDGHYCQQCERDAALLLAENASAKARAQ